jgi:hypothetical protein
MKFSIFHIHSVFFKEKNYCGRDSKPEIHMLRKQNIFTHLRHLVHYGRILIAPNAQQVYHIPEGCPTTYFFHGLFLSLDFFRFAGFNGVTNPGVTSSQQQQLTAARPAPVAQLGEAVRSSQLSSQSAVRNSQPSSQPFTAFRQTVASSVMNRL